MPAELRVALLGEHGDTLLEVVTLERSCFERGDLVARSLVEPLLLGHEVERALVALHRERRGRGDIACEIASASASASSARVLHEAEPERLLGVDRVAGKEEVARAAPWPTSIASRQMLRALRWIPSRPPGIAMRAPIAATRRSHATASCMPGADRRAR